MKLTSILNGDILILSNSTKGIFVAPKYVKTYDDEDAEKVIDKNIVSILKELQGEKTVNLKECFI